jgi:hypothetical protein
MPSAPQIREISAGAGPPRLHLAREIDDEHSRSQPQVHPGCRAFGDPPSFTGAAAAGVVHLTQDANITLTFDAQVAGITLPLPVDVSCTAPPSDIDTAAIVSPVPPQITSGPADTVPSGSAFSYTITSTGTPTPALSLAAGSALQLI